MSSAVKGPAWITRPLSPNDIAAINQGGCASGAYMPAVTYHDARVTMGEHGDAVLDYIEGLDVENPVLDLATDSWSGFSCKVLSLAVELWCVQHEHLEDWDDEDALWEPDGR